MEETEIVDRNYSSLISPVKSSIAVKQLSKSTGITLLRRKNKTPSFEY